MSAGNMRNRQGEKFRRRSNWEKLPSSPSVAPQQPQISRTPASERSERETHLQRRPGRFPLGSAILRHARSSASWRAYRRPLPLASALCGSGTCVQSLCERRMTWQSARPRIRQEKSKKKSGRRKKNGLIFTENTCRVGLVIPFRW